MSTPESPIPPKSTPLISDHADNPDMQELVAYFKRALGERIETIQSAAREGDVGTLQQQAHQLKGSAGGYGYPTIREAAAALEEAAKQADGQDLGSLQSTADKLIALCRSARAAE